MSPWMSPFFLGRLVGHPECKYSLRMLRNARGAGNARRPPLRPAARAAPGELVVENFAVGQNNLLKISPKISPVAWFRGQA